MPMKKPMGASLRMAKRPVSYTVLIGLISAVVVASCGKSEKKGDDNRTSFDPALAAVEVNAATVSDMEGVVTVTVSASSPNTQIVKASESSRIKGTTLSFPPGAFDIDFDVSLEEGKSLATTSNLTKLLDEKAKAVTSAPAVVVAWTYDQDTFSPFRLKIPAPDTPSPMPADGRLVVIALKNQVDQPKRLLSLIPAESLIVAEGFVSFESVSYGAFQAAYISGTSATAKDVQSDDKAQGIGKASAGDKTPPPVPAKPTTNGPVIQSIEPVFTWLPVTDDASGLAYYQLEIGSTPGAADVFNGPVTETTKKIIGFHGKKYYARVSAVDNAGNQSAFSPVSDGIEVDSE